MNYDAIILEMMSRVQTLEQKVKVLEEQNEKPGSLVDEDGFEEQDRETKITRSVARQHVMDKIKKMYGYVDVQKGNRAKQADIILTVNSGENKGKELLGKFFYSKSFNDFPSGWHTLKSSDLEKTYINFYVFTVSFEEKFYNFIFSREEMKQYVLKKAKDSSDQYYFYFHVNDGKKVETRDDERDVETYFENWALFGECIKNI